MTLTRLLKSLMRSKNVFLPTAMKWRMHKLSSLEIYFDIIYSVFARKQNKFGLPGIKGYKILCGELLAYG